jgi:hypothetical protein
MTKILDEVLAANAKHAENFGDKGNLPLPPSRHFAILTCMDTATGWWRSIRSRISYQQPSKLDLPTTC